MAFDDKDLDINDNYHIKDSYNNMNLSKPKPDETIGYTPKSLNHERDYALFDFLCMKPNM